MRNIYVNILAETCLKTILINANHMQFKKKVQRKLFVSIATSMPLSSDPISTCDSITSLYTYAVRINVDE